MRVTFISILLFTFLTGYTQQIIWEEMDPLPVAKMAGSAVTCNNKIYFAGGRTDDRTNTDAWKHVYEYNPETNQWTNKADMLTEKVTFALVSVDDTIYAIGDGNPPYNGNTEKYNPETNQWTSLTPMPTPRQHIKGVVLNDKIYIIGGQDSDRNILTKNEVYDIQTNTWEERAPIPLARLGHSIAVVENKIYVLGGAIQNGNPWEYTSSVHVYDPVANSWEEISPMPTTRFETGIAVINNKIIIAGGMIGDQTSNRVDIFDPVTDTWTQTNSLSSVNALMGSTTYNGDVCLIGGTNAGNSWNAYNNAYKGEFITTGFEIHNKGKLKIFPNPAQNSLHIEYPGLIQMEVNYKIIELSGVTMQEGKLAGNTIDVSKLNKGIYILNLDVEGENTSKKIVIE